MTVVLPPGTVLQQMYLKERLAAIPAGRFIEVGTGQGQLSRLLLNAGWTGTGYDLNPESLACARVANAEAIQAGRYDLQCGNWLETLPNQPADLILSCMVLEHLDDTDEARYFEQCKAHLKPGGRIVLLVPGSPAHWGVEDDIAGHFRRYSRESLSRALQRSGLRCEHMAGLTYPVSNLLLPVSNWLVSRQESQKKALSQREQTRQSGNRKVLFKTTFPSLLKGVLNETVMFPCHLLQKAMRNHPHALVLFAECVIDHEVEPKEPL